MSDETPDVAAPPIRVVNYQRLAAYYRIDPAAENNSATAEPQRYALAMIESREDTSDNYLTTAATFEEACQLAGEEVLDSGRLPDAVYDLHTGARIELHTTTPIVTRSEDQGIMVNPLERDSGEGGEKP
jgi:hypothetical protein